MEKYAIVVDPISSGKFFVDEFKSRGIKCIAVLSDHVPAEFKCGYAPDKYEEVILFDGDVAALSDRLEKFSPVCVMLGFETGLDLADQLATRLGVSGNDPATSAMRRDKYAMHAALQERRVRSVRQFRAENVDAAKDWLLHNQVWPVVVKPANSAGSDNVSICQTLEMALHAVDAILGSVNMLGKTNNCAIVQEYLEGAEWVVDTASCNGTHVVTNVSRYLKTITSDANIVYRHAEFLSASDEQYTELVDYALSVNNALGMHYGAAHLEIIITKQGPVLVELNPRMHGCDAIKALQWCYPVTQLDLSVDAYIAPEAFAEKASHVFKNNKFMLAYYLIAPSAGIVSSVIDVETLQKIASYKMHCLPSVGRTVRKTVSLLTSPGNIWLISDNEQALWADHRRLIDMEDKGQLYTLTAC
jgi:phosphoribosylamine-glycine ligase